MRRLSFSSVSSVRERKSENMTRERAIQELIHFALSKRITLAKISKVRYMYTSMCGDVRYALATEGLSLKLKKSLEKENIDVLELLRTEGLDRESRKYIFNYLEEFKMHILTWKCYSSLANSQLFDMSSLDVVSAGSLKELLQQKIEEAKLGLLSAQNVSKLREYLAKAVEICSWLTSKREMMGAITDLHMQGYLEHLA